MDDGLRRLAEEYWDGASARAPFAATMYGDHRFDDRIPDLSPAGLAEERSFALDIAARAAAVDDTSLTDQERVTRDLLVDVCQRTVEAIDSDQIQLSSDGFTGLPVSLLRSASRLTAPDAASAKHQLDRLEALPTAIDEAVAHWRRGAERGWIPAATIVARTRQMIENYLGGPVAVDPFVELELPTGWTGADGWRTAATATVTQHVRPAYRRAADALADLEAIGRDDDHPGLCHLPGGDDLYRSLVRRATTTDLDPEEIHRFGMDELTDRIPGEWATIGTRALGISRRGELFAHLRSDPALKYDDADQIVECAGDAIQRAVLVVPAWFDRLSDARVVVEEVPASLAPGSPPAYYAAPPTDHSRPGVYYANTHEPTRRNRFEAEVFAFHEAVPGHHLERTSAMARDLPMFQRRGSYMAYSEGWGLYAERLAQEMDIYSSDVMRLGMLSADAWRSARLVLDTGLHAMGWTRTQAIEFMVEHVPIAAGEAEVEVDRYIGMPGQALSYKIGQREMFRLREHAQRCLGPAFDIRGFHTAVLEHGGVTLGILADNVDRWIAAGAGSGADHL